MSTAVDVALEEEMEQKPVTAALVRRLYARTGPYRTLLAINMVATTLAVASGLGGPQFIRYGIDHFLTHITNSAQADRGILVVSALYLANLLIAWGLTVTQVKVAVRAGEGLLSDLRLEVFEHIQRLSLSYFDKTHQGRIINRADGDIEALDQVLTFGINQMQANALTFLGALCILFYQNWRLSLAMGTVLIPFVFAVYFFQKYVMIAYRQVRMQSSRLLASLAENISGVRVVQAMGREGKNLERYEDLNEVYMDRAYDTARIFHTFMPLLGLLWGAAVAIVLGYGGILVLRHEITVGDLSAFILYVGMLFGPIQVMGDLYNTILSAAASGERIFQLLETEPQVADRTGAKQLPVINGEVKFENVSFRYETTPENRWVLDDINFSTQPGQVVALVGHTGSGKTSIISLLARFYEPQQGRILIDGHDIGRTTIQSLHRQLGIVTQENFLFTGTIMDNLRFGRPEATDDEVRAGAAAVGTDDTIRRMKDGYATKVGERGGNLSAGERQLLCITRALIAQPRILILDEATSAVDTKSEALIQSALEILLKGRTTFVIAHRLSTVRKASLILVLQQGKIVERGTHDSLIAQGQVYAGLHEEFARH